MSRIETAFMRIADLHIERFRGFLDLHVRPRRHAVIMGEPGGGRSDLIEALARVLDAEASRTRITTELDFYNRDTAKTIQIGLTLADLGPDLEQHFFDHLELWDEDRKQLVVETDEPEALDVYGYKWVLRLEYQARWLPDEERCDEWIHYPKDADPSVDAFVHVRRADLERLGFGLLRLSGARILNLGPRSTFRHVVDRQAGRDFAAAVAQYVEAVERGASQFTSSSQIKGALEDVLRPLRELLGLQSADVADAFRFAPEGGSPSGLLRSLDASIDTGDNVGSLPVWRRGSTIASLFRIGEALALSSGSDPILAVDDLGDGLDPASASHVASELKRSAGQVWVATRVPAVAEVFNHDEVMRLGKGTQGARVVHQGWQPTTKAEAVAAKHWHRSLLPAFSYPSVVVLEGPNDFTALHTLALRLFKERSEPLPATRGVSLINAGSGGSGGYAAVLKLAGAAREMGLRAIGVVDGDTSGEAQEHLRRHGFLAHAVVRLPDNCAIERALVNGLPADVLRQAIKDIAVAASIAEPRNLDNLSGPALCSTAASFIKNNALHAPFIDALPEPNLPPLGVQLLAKAIEVATGDATGTIQL